ncbi:hypothetical protein IGB42_01595 [Andreprevotia sp. IGB-42]|uniref:ATP-binding protein n=1 Tax=Andreprevotia sp. IGB-42 TaxID=2497473 RepID=UPI00135BBC98|nr:YhaN family protein [Andreprevotia sp. IGB-42]KAF0813916.1 hypothetical protein IGB42_01595 [Andreprevotia sp. IGB-42]
MRLQNLNLVRFGKFTDTDIPLPKAEHDFHLIVGPNEAGKSTVRSAIADLLFGFPQRYTAMSFLHPQPELRLAATVADGDQSLAIVRAKGNKNTLRNAADSPLLDNALQPFMGLADRYFFETMFGLSHAQLVAGGELILDASKDVSQILFQSAAGIAGLGKVKDGLIVEADHLWGPRQSGSRAYYQASTEYEQASKDLKAATVRSKNWGEARAMLDDVEARIAAATERKGELVMARAKLERIRRLAPKVIDLKQKLAELEALGEVLDFPSNASETVTTGEQEASIAETKLRQCKLMVEQLTQQRDEAVFDADILAAKDEIQALADHGQSVRNHHAELISLQEDVERSLTLARAAAAELGWSELKDEAGLLALLPDMFALRDVHRLVNERGGLLQGMVSATEGIEEKELELAEVEAELATIAVVEVSPAFRSALSEAQVYRNTLANQKRLGVVVATAQRHYDTAYANLGEWKRTPDALQQMPVPSAERLNGLCTQRQRLESALGTATDRLEQVEQDVGRATLAVKQFVEARHIVTASDVREARSKRDYEWGNIKDGSTQLASSAAGLDAAIKLADELVDTQLGSTTDAASLQSLIQQVERAQAELKVAEQSKDGRAAALITFDQGWQSEAIALSLPRLALEDAQVWMSKREAVLSSFIALGEKQDEFNREVDESGTAARNLANQLALAGCIVPPENTLAAILTQAETMVADLDGAVTRRMQLLKHRDGGSTALHRLKAAEASARSAFNDWEKSWSRAITAAKLNNYVKSVDDAEQALFKVDAFRQNLDKAIATRRDRIDIMNSDLEAFGKLATRVVEILKAEDLYGADARDVVRTLSPKLKLAEANEASRAAADVALRAASKQRDDAQNQVEQVQAKVAPLLALAGVTMLSEAAPLVEKWEIKRRLIIEIDLARAGLIQDAEGFALDVVISEVEGRDLAQIPAELTKTGDEIEQVQAEQTCLAVEQTKAKIDMEAFGGGRDAAVAEARRQEALAGMANASERYIKVTAAAKLLSWAIERYREQNQGPMLARAGAIFATLTLGRYTKLFVDFVHTPYSLSAVRMDGKTVEVPGMSEGTRDQLYLALRIAALELHLAKAKALPFVADDLFINFDDERSTAGLQALRDLSRQTQVLFLSHHDHLLPRVQQVFGMGVNVVHLQR